MSPNTCHHHRMRLGVLMIPTDPWPVARDRARHLEALGFAHLWTYDHLSWQRYRDATWFGAIPWLTGIAAATSRIRLGTMVTSPNFRHPVTLAKDAVTLDHISEGRLTLGIGAGGIGFDATVFGAPILTPGQRAQRLEDFVDVLDGVLSHPDSFSTDNERYPVVESQMIPGCVQQPRVPLAIAAAGPRTIALAAARGDAWITEGDPREPNPDRDTVTIAMQHQVGLFERACADVGRDPRALDRIFLLSNRAERPLKDMATFRDFVARYEDLGFTDLVIHDPRPGDPFWDDDPAMIEQIADVYRDA